MKSICPLLPGYTDICSSTFKKPGIFPGSPIFQYFWTTVHPEGSWDHIFELFQYPERLILLGPVTRFVLNTSSPSSSQELTFIEFFFLGFRH